MPTMEQLGVPAINTMGYYELSSELEIPEWSHLSRKIQDDWSHLIVPYIE